jgi:PAS domain S-box-containing protein
MASRVGWGPPPRSLGRRDRANLQRRHDRVPAEYDLAETRAEKTQCLILATSEGRIRDMTNADGGPGRRLDVEQELQIKNWAIESAGHAVAISDLEGILEYVNPAFLRLWRYDSSEEVLGRSAVEFWQTAESAQVIIRELGVSGRWTGELPARAKDGGEFYVELTASMIKDADGQPIRMMGWFVDITGRRNAEQALRESTDRFRKIIEQAPIAMAVVTMESVIEFVNRKAVEVFGYLPDDIPTMDRWWVLAYPDPACRQEVVADWTRRVEKALAEGEEIQGNEYQVTCKDGTVKTMFITGVPVANRIFVMFDDITARKQAERLLRESEERFSKAFRISPYAYLIAEMAGGRIVEVNDAFTTMSGYTREEALASTTLSLKVWVREEDRQQMVTLLRETGTVSAMETMLRAKSGYVRTVLFNARVIQVNQKPCIISTIEDITDRRKTEALLVHAQKLEALGVLAGGISHDFNNLLTGIFGYIDLARTVSHESETREHLESALSALNRARALTLQLLTFAKGGAPVQKITLLTPFIEDTVHFALSGSNVSCRFSLPKTLWPCNIDRNQIGQVIDNIVINAQQAMPLGGTIEISATNTPVDEKSRLPLARGDYVRVSIRDFGIGIPREVLPRIFDPFYTTKAKGHGLGLATCYSIVSRHGGCIEVASEPGKGSTFHVYLPASPGTASARPAAAARHRGSGTVIVVDDEEVVRRVIQKMLETMGYSVISAGDGWAAIDLYKRESAAGRRISAMIVDLTVPGGMGGVETVAEIRHLDAEMPVFVASGYAENSVMTNPLEHGFTASISKPFTIADLSEVLNRHMPG